MHKSQALLAHGLVQCAGTQRKHPKFARLLLQSHRAVAWRHPSDARRGGDPLISVKLKLPAKHSTCKPSVDAHQPRGSKQPPSLLLAPLHSPHRFAPDLRSTRHAYMKRPSCPFPLPQRWPSTRRMLPPPAGAHLHSLRVRQSAPRPPRRPGTLQTA
jgi:hypothetical protein